MSDLCIVTGYWGPCLYRDVTSTAIDAYASRWGCSVAREFIDDPPRFGRHPYWHKQDLLRRTYGAASWMLWLDADCLITNHAFDVGAMCSDVGDETDVIASDQGGEAHAGVFLLRRSPGGKAFLDEWWDRGDEDHPAWRKMHAEGHWTLVMNDNWVLKQMLPRANCLLVPAKGFVTTPRDWDGSDFVLHAAGTTEREKDEILRTRAS